MPDLSTTRSDMLTATHDALAAVPSLDAAPYAFRPSVRNGALCLIADVPVPSLPDQSAETLALVRTHLDMQSYNVNYPNLNPTVFLSSDAFVKDDSIHATIFIPLQKLPESFTLEDLATTVDNSVAVSTVNHTHRFI